MATDHGAPGATDSAVFPVRGMASIEVQIDTLSTTDGSPTWFSAFTEGQRWNGWATPYFTKTEADRLVAVFNNRRAGRAAGTAARYDEPRDCYVFVDDDSDLPPEEYGPILIAGRKLYPIGAYNWCWSARGDFDD